MAAAADLNSGAARKFGRVDDGFALFEQCGFGQSHMPGTGTVACFAADARFGEGALLGIVGIQLDTRGVTTTALEQPGPLLPVVFVIVYPAPDSVLNWMGVM